LDTANGLPAAAATEGGAQSKRTKGASRAKMTTNRDKIGESGKVLPSLFVTQQQ